MVDLQLADAYSTPWDLWASDVAEQLASYNVPSPGTEDSWKTWAASVSSVPEVAALGCIDPAPYSNWRDWAAALLFTVK